MRSFSDAGRVLGALEERLMEILWRTSPLSVREVWQRLAGDPPLAYTTVMTTLDRLHRKGLLARDKAGNAFHYRAALSRDDYHRRVVEETVARLLRTSTDPVMAAFVDAAAGLDQANLDRLERLIRRRRKAGR